MRLMFENYNAIIKKLEHLEQKDIEQEEKFMLIFEYLKKLEEDRKQELDQQNRKPIGYKTKKQ